MTSAEACEKVRERITDNPGARVSPKEIVVPGVFKTAGNSFVIFESGAVLNSEDIRTLLDWMDAHAEKGEGK